MVSVFFRCNCPYVGYTLKRVDYVNQVMAECTASDMTKTGHAFLHNSGSYMLLAQVEGKKYFHSRQTKSKAYDDQNRPVYTNVALVGSTEADALVISRIAGYALLDESSFYQEIAKMVTLLDGDFTVDFSALQAFLNRFEQNYQVETTDATVKKLCEDVFFKNSRKEIEFIVLEADLPYFNKQLGRLFSPAFSFTYQQAKKLGESAKIRFPQKEKYVPSVVSEALDPETSVESDDRQEENAHSANMELAALQKKYELLESEHKENLRAKTAMKDDWDKARQAVAMVEDELTHLKSMLKKNFWLGLAAGAIGTAIAVLILKILK